MRAALIATVLLLTVAQGASASVRAGWVSEQESPSRASAGASVEVSAQSPGGPGGSEATAAPAVISSPESSSADAGTPIPASESSSTSSAMAGGEVTNTCEVRWVVPCALPQGVPTPPARATAGRPRPNVSPAVLASAAAGRIPLVAGGIQASPSAKADGLTGAASWFWLSSSPAAPSLTVSAGGEHVTVSAAPSDVRWSFGDGSSLSGGPGVPYRPGPVPAGAVRHVYEVRCLPGDQGRDPNVLPSCGPDGYTVSASVVWAISYHASGPVSSGGALPSRTTTSSLVYPVGEVRAFLTASSGARG